MVLQPSSLADITFRSDFTAELLNAANQDADIASSARVSFGNRELSYSHEDDERLINYLMREKHGTPFEQTFLQFGISCPIFIAREFLRHRIGFSYNEFSTRYKKIEPVFYTPTKTRKLVKIGKPGNYQHVAGAEWQSAFVRAAHNKSAYEAWALYTSMLQAGITEEVARNVLPFHIYTSFVVSCNLRSFMNLYELRTTAAQSKPLDEFDTLTRHMSVPVQHMFPISWAAFKAVGFRAP